METDVNDFTSVKTCDGLLNLRITPIIHEAESGEGSVLTTEVHAEPTAAEFLGRLTGGIRPGENIYDQVFRVSKECCGLRPGCPGLGWG